MADWPWLIAQPIAHRGLHHPAGAVENTLAAADAAACSGFAIECDVRPSRDGIPMVFHDATLERLTRTAGALDAQLAQDLGRVAFRRGPPGVPTLAALLAQVAARVPVVIELKSAFDSDVRLAGRVAAVIAVYDGPVALKSFDVEIMLALRTLALSRPLGLVAAGVFRAADWPEPTPDRLAALRRYDRLALLDPDFLSWSIADLPHPVAQAFRARGRPLMAWTVRTHAQRLRAADHADAIVFEGPNVGVDVKPAK